MANAPKKKKQQQGCIVSVIVVIAALIIIGELSGGSKTETHDNSSEPCSEFRSAAHDYTLGVLTPDELRNRLKTVRADASVATAAVQRAATNMLSALTLGAGDAFASAITEMGSACAATGN